MSLIGTERIRVFGVINGGLAATEETVTVQNIANLANSGTTTLTGLEPVSVRGTGSNGSPSPVPFNTTTGAIAALGSIAPSTLKGTEIIAIGPKETGSAPSAYYLFTTTLNVANS